MKNSLTAEKVREILEDYKGNRLFTLLKLRDPSKNIEELSNRLCVPLNVMESIYKNEKTNLTYGYLISMSSYIGITTNELMKYCGGQPRGDFHEIVDKVTNKLIQEAKLLEPLNEAVARKFYENGIKDLEPIRLGLNDLQIFRKEYFTPTELDLLLHTTKKFLSFTKEFSHPDGGTQIIMTRTEEQLVTLTDLYKEYYKYYQDENKEQLRCEIDKYQGELYKYPPSAIKYFCKNNKKSKITIRCGSKAFVTHLKYLEESVIHIKQEWHELLKNNKIELEFD